MSKKRLNRTARGRIVATLVVVLYVALMVLLVGWQALIVIGAVFAIVGIAIGAAAWINAGGD